MSHIPEEAEITLTKGKIISRPRQIVWLWVQVHTKPKLHPLLALVKFDVSMKGRKGNPNTFTTLVHPQFQYVITTHCRTFSRAPRGKKALSINTEKRSKSNLRLTTFASGHLSNDMNYVSLIHYCSLSSIQVLCFQLLSKKMKQNHSQWCEKINHELWNLSLSIFFSYLLHLFLLC